MRELLGRERGGRMVVVNVDTAFIAEGRYPGQVTIGTGMVSRSKRSFVIGQALFQDGRCFSAADTTIVYLEGSATADLPAELDATFERLRLPGVA
jgi:acyl-CoA thioester hydrolase